MNQPSPEHQSQIQENLVKDTNIGRDFIFAPIQADKYIETEIIQISVAKVTQRELIKTSPYQGLKRFNFKDKDRFFGRDKLIARLFHAVNRSPLTLVLGASGSGKSSVVRAGLIPELKKSLKSSKFYDFIFTPHEDPFESLYRCLLSEEKDYSFSKSEAKIALKAERDTLAEIIKKLKKDDERWLIFVDQFEELFTSCHDVDKRNNFIASLVQVANSGDNSVKILLAMRADFLEQLSSYPALGAIANENNIHLVTDMHPDELRQAIEQPAAKHGVVFEEGLVEQIIEEVEGQKGYLPLLQYTLDLLWQIECRTVGADGHYKIENRTLNQTSYAALEGVRGALQKRVNDIYHNLNQEEQSATQKIFVKLVTILDTESGSKTVSRRANRSEFVGESVNKTLQTFIDENLLVSSYEDLSAEKLQVSDSELSKQSATVEIAHEILLSSWDKLKSWIEQEKEAIILKNWLAGETRRWQKIRLENESNAREELLKGSRLEQVVEFRKKDAFQNIGGFRVEENEFIDASVEYHKFTIRFQGCAIKSLVLLFIAVLVAAVVAGWQWRQTEEQKQRTNFYLQHLLIIVYKEEFKYDFLLRREVTPRIQEIADDQKLSKEVRAGAINYLGNGYYLQAICDEGLCLGRQETANRQRKQYLEEALAKNIQDQKKYLKDALEKHIVALEVLPTFTAAAHDAALACEGLSQLEPDKAEMWIQEAVKYWELAIKLSSNDPNFPAQYEPQIRKHIQSLESRK